MGSSSMAEALMSQMARHEPETEKEPAPKKEERAPLGSLKGAAARRVFSAIKTQDEDQFIKAMDAAFRIWKAEEDAS